MPKAKEKGWVRARDEKYYVGQEIDFTANYDDHAPEAVLKAMFHNYMPDRADAKYVDLNQKGKKPLRGYWYFKVKLLNPSRGFSYEESVEWAQSSYVGGKGVVPGHLAVAFAEQFPLLVMLGDVKLTGGIWRHENRLTCIELTQGINGSQDILAFRYQDGGMVSDHDICPVIIEQEQIVVPTRRGHGY